jgi:hypothetical protein
MKNRNHIRQPTKKEKAQLVHYVQIINDWHADIASYDTALWFVAVYDAYNMCGHKGKTMVAINTDGMTHLLAWNAEGELYPILSYTLRLLVDDKTGQLRGGGA